MNNLMNALKYNTIDVRKLYYLASPFSDRHKCVEDLREKQISIIAGKLMILYGLHLITPITSSYRLKQLVPELGTTWEFWKNHDEEYIKNSDGLIVAKLNGWNTSVGVQAEIEIALGLKIPIYYLELSDINKLLNGEHDDISSIRYN